MRSRPRSDERKAAPQAAILRESCRRGGVRLTDGWRFSRTAGGKPRAERCPGRDVYVMARETSFRKSTTREYFESVVIAVILALFVRTWVVQAFKIPTGSMEQNLLIGDHLLVNKFVYAPTATALERLLLPIGDIERGDVLVFKFPEDPERDFIKRVIGLPGETIELRQGRVFIDGNAIDEPYLDAMRPGGRLPPDFRGTFGPAAVPEGHLFMMGDNRGRLRDSRYWGPMPVEYVKGRAFHALLVLRVRERLLRRRRRRRDPAPARLRRHPLPSPAPAGTACSWRCRRAARGRKSPLHSSGDASRLTALCGRTVCSPRLPYAQYAPSSRLVRHGRTSARGRTTARWRHRRSRCNAGFHHGLLRPEVNGAEPAAPAPRTRFRRRGAAGGRRGRCRPGPSWLPPRSRPRSRGSSPSRARRAGPIRGRRPAARSLSPRRRSNQGRAVSGSSDQGGRVISPHRRDGAAVGGCLHDAPRLVFPRPVLGRLVGEVDLNQELRRPARVGRGLIEPLEQGRAVDGVDPVERDGLARPCSTAGGPMRCQRMGSDGVAPCFCRASWIRFSPRSRSPAAAAASTWATPNVFRHPRSGGSRGACVRPPPPHGRAGRGRRRDWPRSWFRAPWFEVTDSGRNG